MPRKSKLATRETESTESAPQLVAVGASAGGVDALSRLVATLPTPFPAPVVIAQHLDPRRESHLVSILEKHSTLPLVTVEESSRLEPGTIYVVPPNRHVRIHDHTVSVLQDGPARPMPSVDALFQTAARFYAEGLIAVILTGAGSDGADGARHVKLAGGTVVIQDPQTASFPAMPASLAPTTVDVVADLEAIGPLLGDLLSGTYQPLDDEQPALEVFLAQMRERTGLDFTKYKRPTLLRRLQRRMLAVHAESLKQYLRYVRNHPDEYHRLAASFLIKVTEFFRDPELFTYLGERVIPQLIEEAARGSGELRFWSAGCATGEEAYSLAIVANEALGSRSDVRLRIFATDVDNEAIEFARRGIFAPNALERVPEDLRQRYFTEVGGHYEISPAIRGLIAFGQHDLAMRAPFPRIDMTVCRNVLIYFTNDLQRRALQLFAFSLRDGGYLVLGKSETSTPLGDHFSLEAPRLKVYRRRGSRVLLPATGLDGGLEIPQLPSVMPHRRPPLQEAGLGRMVADAQRVRVQAGRSDQVLHRLPIGIVIVDRKYDIAFINSSARTMLSVHGTAVGQDLVHLARGVSSIELRRGIDSAFRGEPWRAAWDLPTSETPLPDIRSLEVTAYRHGQDGDGEMVVLVLRDVSDERGESRSLKRELDEERGRVAALTDQLERMAEVTTTLREANEEFTAVNAGLRSQNEELVVSQEEIQAATEEVETLNEEMQATNEELETLNEELQATVEELNTTNDDLEARSSELQGLALSLEKQREVSEEERARLAAILGSMAEAVVVVDDQGQLMQANEAYDRIADLLEQAELEGEDGQPISADETPTARAGRGESFVIGFSLIGDDGARRWFEATGRPLSAEGAGGVVVFRDITDRSLQRIQSEFLATLSHELRTPLTGLSAYLEMLARRVADADDETLTKYTERSLSQVRRFTALVDELFDANRVSTGRLSYQMRPQELANIVEEAVELARGLDEERDIRFDPGRARLVVRGDANRLQQVVFNLVANAIRHAPDSPRIDVRLRRRGAGAELSVRDWGPGVSVKDAQHLFKRLETATDGSSEGLGLGLYISHAIVEAHGGSIHVDSEPGEGATFVVRLPLERTP